MLVRGACPLPSEIVSLSIRTKTMPAKMVASNERIAPGLICSTSTHQLAELARGRGEETGGRTPEKVAEHDPDHDRDHQNQARNVVYSAAEVVGDRLAASEEGPGFEGKRQEDPADEGCHQGGNEIGAVENQPFQSTRNSFCFSSTLVPITGWSSIAGEYLLDGTVRPRASAIART